MTLDSYKNYVTNIACCLSEKSALLSDMVAKDSCNIQELQMDINILNAYIDIMRCFKPPQEDVDGNIDETINCLSITEMKQITEVTNKICNTNYCVDYFISYS